MTSNKERLTVTVDAEILAAITAAVETGHARSLSAWVNRALADRLEQEQRLSALADAVAAYEAEFGTISDAEMRAQARADRANAVVVRPARAAAPAPRRRKRARAT